MNIKNAIINYMDEKSYKPLTKDQLAIRFQLKPREFKEFYKVLDELENEGIILKTLNEKYGLISKLNVIVGILEGHDRGFGFVVDKTRYENDVFIPAEAMNGAMSGDKVIATITKKQEGDKREEGEIFKILERKNKFIVGTFEASKNFGFLIPDDHKINYDIFIPKSSVGKAKNNDKVVVEIIKWPEARRNPEGKIVEILGKLGDKGVDILSIAKQFKIPQKFSAKTMAMAKKLGDEVEEKDIVGRKDFRDLNIFTIDGPDAKDLDDAISIEILSNGNYQLGVHIADVSHYVKEDSPMDRDAYERGNSVYLLDRVIPMLPKELSNGICSLNPNQDRLTLSIVMEINSKGHVVDHQIYESIINSKNRLIYDDVSDLLEDKYLKIPDHLLTVADDLFIMRDLSLLLKAKREIRGSIDFDFPESKIILDQDGFPVDVYKEERRIANMLIEEFMLVSNEVIAENFFWSEIPFLYRIHEEPTEEKMSDFNKLIYNFGYSIKGNEIYPKDLQLLLKEIRGKKEEIVISTLLLRSLRKAIYCSEPDIHFGLAAKYYTHFTAPIRRYPDLTIHRIIKKHIKGKLNQKSINYLENNLAEIADHTSITERRAEEAEREVEDLKKAQYMSQFIGEDFQGIISSLTNFGMFVQLENTVEGLIHFGNMVDDYYHFDEEKYYVIGERTNKIYRLGDTVKITVVSTDIYKKTIDFQFADDNIDSLE